MKPTMLAAASMSVALQVSTPAFAWYDICNKTPNRVQVAVGYIGNEGYVSKGWWTIRPCDCKTVVGDGQADDTYNYWYYAEDLDDGGSWSGGSDFCTTPSRFTIVGKNCSNRGYDWTGFKHVQTSGGNYTTNLTSRDGHVCMG